MLSLPREKSDERIIAVDAATDHVPGQSHVLRLDAGIVPRGDVTGLGLLFVQEGLRAEVEGWIHVRHAVQQDRGLAGIRRIAGDGIGLRQGLDPAEDTLLPLTVNQIRPHEPPALVPFHVSVAVIDAEAVQPIGGIGMILIKKQRSIGKRRIKEARGIQARAVKGGKIIRGKRIAAMRAPHLPRPCHRVGPPVVHGHIAAAGGTEPVGLDHPRPRDRRTEHHRPEIVIGHGVPRRCRTANAIGKTSCPVVPGNIGPQRVPAPTEDRTCCVLSLQCAPCYTTQRPCRPRKANSPCIVPKMVTTAKCHRNSKKKIYPSG